MSRIADRRKVDAKLGPSRLVPFVASNRERHQRRLASALEGEPRMREWCEAVGLTLRISNNGQHWQFMRGLEKFAQWWPSTARLSRNKFTLHAHDHEQVRVQLAVWVIQEPIP